MAESGNASAATEWRANWTLVAAAMVGYSVSTLPAGSIGVMMAPIEQEFGWSRTEIYSGISLISFVAVLISAFIGAAIDKIGARRIGIGAALLLCAAIALLSTVKSSLWQWWAIWAMVGVAGAAMPTVWLAPVASRFTASRGLAVAFVLSGSGLATFLVPIITNALVESHGWRGGYLGLGFIWALLALPVILLFFRSERRSVPAHAAAPSPTDLPGLTVREGFRSPTFYTLLLAAFGSLFGGVALVLNLVPVLTSSGIERGTAAAVSGLIGIATITGRVFGGWLMDRVSAKWIAALSTFAATVLPLSLLLFPGSVAAAAIGVVGYGLVAGAKIGAIAYLASRHLGQRAFGTLYGTINAMVALAVGVAPLAANYVYDRTHSYEPTMWAAVPILAVAALLYLSLGKYPDFTKRELVEVA
jgi:MFS family permease